MMVLPMKHCYNQCVQEEGEGACLGEADQWLFVVHC